MYETKKSNFTLKANTDVECELRIPQQIVEEIEMYHQNYPGKEWSGPIFYDIISGSLSEGNLVIRITDLAIADAGSECYTEYSFQELLKNDYWFEKMASNKQGGLHTHHNMGCFFSGTDNQELTDNTHRYIDPDDFYLSVIVNAKGTGEWIARICKRVSSKVTVTEEKVIKTYVQEFEEKYPWLISKYQVDEEGHIVPIQHPVVTKTSSTVDEETFLYTDCKIVIEDGTVDYKQCLTRLMAFSKLKDTKTVARSYQSTYHNTHQNTNQHQNFRDNGTAVGTSFKSHSLFDNSENYHYLNNTMDTSFVRMYDFKAKFGNWGPTEKNPNGYSLMKSPNYFDWFKEVCEDIYTHYNKITKQILTVNELTEIIKDLDKWERTFVSTFPGKSRQQSDTIIKSRIKDLKVFRDLFLTEYWDEYKDTESDNIVTYPYGEH